MGLRDLLFSKSRSLGTPRTTNWLASSGARPHTKKSVWNVDTGMEEVLEESSGIWFLGFSNQDLRWIRVNLSWKPLCCSSCGSHRSGWCPPSRWGGWLSWTIADCTGSHWVRGIWVVPIWWVPKSIFHSDRTLLRPEHLPRPQTDYSTPLMRHSPPIRSELSPWDSWGRSSRRDWAYCRPQWIFSQIRICDKVDLNWYSSLPFQHLSFDCSLLCTGHWWWPCHRQSKCQYIHPFRPLKSD